MLEINEQAKLNLKLFGKEYVLVKPTKRQLRGIQGALKTEEGKEEALDYMEKLLVECGLPEEQASQLQVEHLSLIVEHLIGTKKN